MRRIHPDKSSFWVAHYEQNSGSLCSRIVAHFRPDYSLGAFPVDIESSIRTDWFNNSCSESYEYIEERKKYHIFKLIPYKVTASKRKLMAVA